MNLVDNLDYAQIIENEPTNDQQIEVLNRLKAIDSGKMSTHFLKMPKEDIFKR